MNRRPAFISILAATALAGAMTALNLSMPHGLAPGMPFVLVVAIGYWAPSSRAVIILAAIASGLNILAFFISEKAGADGMALANRGLALAVIWAATGLLIRLKQSLQDLIQTHRALTANIGDQTTEITTRMRPFEVFASNMAGGLIYIDLDSRNRFVNKVYANWFELEPEDFTGRTIGEVLGDAIAAEVLAPLERVLAGQEVTYEAARTSDGGIRDVQVTGVPDVTADGTVVGAFVLVTDVTEIKLRERALRESQHGLVLRNRLLQVTIDSWPGSVSLRDTAGRFVYVSNFFDGPHRSTGRKAGRPHARRSVGSD